MMLITKKIAAAVCLLIVILIPVLPAKAMTIAQNGSSKAVIVVAQDAPLQHQHAAKELAEFLFQVTGSEFKVVNDAPSGSTRILIGPKAARMAEPDFSTEGLRKEGIIIRTKRDDLILAGGYPRGTLYAVYTFLENEIGCRWWSSTESTIPKKPTIQVEKLDMRYVPVLKYRYPFWFDTFDADWAVRNKSNGGLGSRLDDKRGGHHLWLGWCHTFYELIPSEKYFEKHPDWFSEIDGERVCRYGQKKKLAQLCLSNEEMRKELVKNLKEKLRQNPNATIAEVSQNDGYGGYCQCQRCSAVAKKEGSRSGPILQFVNAIAADIEEEFPNVAVSTLAYVYSSKPPLHVKPRHNVIIRLCNYESDYGKPITDKSNKAFYDELTGWSKICNRLYIWNYVVNFKHFMLPHPNLRGLEPDIKLFVKHNVHGIFEQGAQMCRRTEFAELRAWVLAKLLWDPTLNGQELIDEFVDGYYGPAGKYIKNYINLTHDTLEQSGYRLKNAPHTAKFLTFDMLNKGWHYLKEAENAVLDDPELRFRVQVAQLPVIYTFIMGWDDMRQKARLSQSAWPMPETAQKALDNFMEVAKKGNLTHHRERPADNWAVLRDAIKKPNERLSPNQKYSIPIR